MDRHVTWIKFEKMDVVENLKNKTRKEGENTRGDNIKASEPPGKLKISGERKAGRGI